VRPDFLVRRSVGEAGCSLKISEDVRQYAAEQAISEEEAIRQGMEEKSREFVEAGAEVYVSS
jgi:phosphomethylpyrimidine synthase